MYWRTLRGAAAGLGVAGVCVPLALLVRESWSLVLGPGALRAADVLLALVASGALLLALWLLLGLALSALSRLPGALGRGFTVLAHRVTPAALRRTVALLLGTSLAAAAAPGTALATSWPAGRPTVAPVSAGQQALGDGQSLPDAAPASTLDPLHTPPRTASAAADRYVVRRGDTL